MVCWATASEGTIKWIFLMNFLNWVCHLFFLADVQNLFRKTFSFSFDISSIGFKHLVPPELASHSVMYEDEIFRKFRRKNFSKAERMMVNQLQRWKPRVRARQELEDFIRQKSQAIQSRKRSHESFEVVLFRNWRNKRARNYDCKGTRQTTFTIF